MNLRVFCISSQSHRFLLHSCTHDVPVALTLPMTHHFNATRANVSCARLRQPSAPLLILVRSVSAPFVGGLIRISHVVSPCETHLLAYTYKSLRLCRDFWWWTLLTRVYCRVNEHLVSKDTGQKRQILKSDSGTTPRVLPIPKQQSNLNDDGSSDES